MNKTFFLLGKVALAAALLLPPALPAASTFYVSPAGDDANPGTRARPVRSLERARDLVRAVNQKAASDITVYLETGIYRLHAPLALDARDSGPPGQNIVYTAAAGGHPVVTGAVPVTGWRVVDGARNLWAAEPPRGLGATRQLFVDGVRAHRAAGRLPFKVTPTASGYAADAELHSGTNLQAAEFVYTGGDSLWNVPSEGLGGWTEPRCPVALIAGTAITMAEPCWDNCTRRVMMPESSGFKHAASLVGPASIGPAPVYAENSYEFLGTPGQWYYGRAPTDDGAPLIYYVPRHGEEMTNVDVEAPFLEKLIVGEGTATEPIHNLVFKGIEFTGATWLFPSGPDGFAEIQANYMVTGSDGWARQGLGDLVPEGGKPYGAWTKTPGNISFSHDRRIEFKHCAFVHLGGAGLELGNGSQSNVVESCVFTDISGSGVELGGVDRPEATGGDRTSENRIVNNHIYNVATEYHGGVGIFVGYARRTIIQHNQLDHLPYTAISLGWGGWLDKIKQPGVANYSESNLVADNLIFDHMRLLADGAGIYTQGLTGPSLAAGERIEGNVIRDQFGSGHAIYTDNGCKNVTVKKNVIVNANFDDWGSRHHDYYNGQDGSEYDHFLMEDNYWQQGDADDSEKNVVLRRNHLISALDQAPAGLVENAGVEPYFQDILKQSFARGAAAPDAPDRLAAWGGDGFVLLAWNPPSFEGATPVDSYLIIASTGRTLTIPATEFRTNGYAKFPGLDNGVNYTFTVSARNAAGLSAPSFASLPVQCAASATARPGPPRSVTAFYSEDKASVHFQAPESDGGSPILGYVVTVQPEDRKVMFAGRAVLTLKRFHQTFVVIDNLAPGANPRLEIAAVNASGEGPKAEVPAAR